MDKFHSLYEQYSLVKEKMLENDMDFATNLLQYGITEGYYKKIDQATELLYKLYSSKLTGSDIRNALTYRLDDNHSENVKFCVLIDVLRCYDGLDHATSITTPEGIALLILLDKFIGNREIIAYSQLEDVSSPTIALIDIIPYISECSDALGSKYSLFFPLILEKKAPEIVSLYRRLIYNLCKTIAEVDGVITIAEQEWLNEIALLNDEDPNNDIDLNGL